MSKLLDVKINETLVKMLEKYDMNVGQTDDYFFVDGLFPGIVAQAFKMEDFGTSVVVQVDITMLFPEQHFVESFVAQAGTVEDAISDAMDQFEVNVLHTFIMAFWGTAKKEENGVGTEVWEIDGHRWQAVVSNFGYRGAEEFDDVIDDLENVYDAIKENIVSYALTENIYAIRTVYTNTSEGENVVETYINNQDFPSLNEAVSGLNWKSSENFYSVRNLVLVMKLIDENTEIADVK
jgi:hypothetical protein